MREGSPDRGCVTSKDARVGFLLRSYTWGSLLTFDWSDRLFLPFSEIKCDFDSLQDTLEMFTLSEHASKEVSQVLDVSDCYRDIVLSHFDGSDSEAPRPRL